MGSGAGIESPLNPYDNGILIDYAHRIKEQGNISRLLDLEQKLGDFEIQQQESSLFEDLTVKS